MNEGPRHATTSDIPGWPTPSRVRDIPKTAGSWGWIRVTGSAPGPHGGGVYQDEIGRLWVDGDMIPRFRQLPDGDTNPGGYVYWTEDGIGLYIDPKSYPYLGDISSLDMEPDRWLPVATVAQELPEFAKNH
jgi:hypothetical protein